jgi:hypothetical protein
MSRIHEQGSLLSSMMEAADCSEVSVPEYMASQTNLHFEGLTLAWY